MQDDWEGQLEDVLEEVEVADDRLWHWHDYMPFRDPDSDDDPNLDDVETVRVWLAQSLTACTVSAGDLRTMRDFDMLLYFGSVEIDDWEDFPAECSMELQAIGVRLFRRDRTFWTRLRKLGPTPALVAEANAILRPRRLREANAARPGQHARRPRGSAPGQGRASRREHRAPSRRRSTSASRGSPDSDDGPSPPPPELKLWRHPHYGAASPNLLRLLLEEAKR